jgi:hypothetical protein
MGSARACHGSVIGRRDGCQGGSRVGGTTNEGEQLDAWRPLVCVCCSVTGASPTGQTSKPRPWSSIPGPGPMCGWASCKLTARHYAVVDVAVHHNGASPQSASQRSQGVSLHRTRDWPGPRLPFWYDGATSQPAANALLCTYAMRTSCSVLCTSTRVGRATLASRPSYRYQGPWAMYSTDHGWPCFPKATLFVSRPLQDCRWALWTVGPLPACHLLHTRMPTARILSSSPLLGWPNFIQIAATAAAPIVYFPFFPLQQVSSI